MAATVDSSPFAAGAPVTTDLPGPSYTPWTATSGEVQPEIKLAATRFVEAAGNWSTRAQMQNGPDAALGSVDGVSILHPDDAGASALQVLYPQYGGIGPDRAAVIVLFDQTLQSAQRPFESRQMTLDVRLVRDLATGTPWAVEKVNPLTSLGSPTALTPTALAVLDEPRITLSAPARLDIATGRVHETLLQIMLGLAQRVSYAVQVMHTGHIQTVFPHPRLSNHAVGRAVDIREIDGVRVVDLPPTSQVIADVIGQAAQLGATEVGGPIDLNGARPGFFTDDVHRDHIHIGVNPGERPAHLR